MEKEASGHLEMILAFTIFIGIVVFLLIYIQPLETQKLSDVAVISLKNSFDKATEINLTTIYVNSSTRCAPQGYGDKSIDKDVAGEGSFYMVLFSQEITNSLPECSSGTFNIGSVSNKKVVSKSALDSMQNKYSSNYSGLKEDLKIPNVIDFEIYSLDDSYRLVKGDLGEIDIVAREYLINILDSDGNLESERFVFRVW